MIDRVRAWFKLSGRLLVAVLAMRMVCLLAATGADDVRLVTPLTEAQKGRIQERDAILKRAEELVQTRKWQEAIGEVEKMLAIERMVFGNEHDDVIGSLGSLRELHVQCENFARAKNAAEELLAIQTKRFGPADWRVTDARIELDNVGRQERLTPVNRKRLAEAFANYEAAATLNEAGQTAAAIEKTRESAEIYRELLGNRHPGYATLLESLAMFHRLQGEHEKAEPFCREALAIRKEVLGERHPGLASLLGDLARLRASQKDFTSAATLDRQAFEITMQTRGERHPDCLMYLEHIAADYVALDDAAKMLPVRREILEFLKRTQDEETARYASALNDLAQLQDALGDSPQAEPLYRRALQITKRIHGVRHPDYAVYLHNLARLHRYQGDYDKAETLYREALAIVKEVHGTQHLDYATCLHSLAVMYLYQGQYIEAESLCTETIQIRKMLLDEQHPDYAASLDVSAAIYGSLGNYQEAERLYRQMLEITRRASGEQHPNYAHYLNSLAMLFQSQGEHTKAVPLLQQAMEIWKQRLGERHPDYGVSLNNLSLTLSFLGRAEEAMPLARRAARIQRANVEAFAAIQSDRQQFLINKKNREALDTLVTVMIASGKTTARDYEEVLQVKGRVWQRQLTARAMAHAANGDPQLTRLLDEIRALSTRRAKLTLTVPEPKDQEVWRKQLAELADQQEERERELSEKNTAIRAAQKPVAPEDVLRELPPDTVLVDVFEYAHFASDPDQQPSVTSERRLVAFILRRGSADIRLVELGSVPMLSEAIDTWRQSFGELPAAQAAGRLLRQKIWEPLEPHLKEAKLVLISPDGVLGRFPLAALPGNERDSYLLEDVSLAVVPCAMAIPRMLATNGGEPRHDVAGNLLVLGNVNYDSTAPAPMSEPTQSFGRFAARRGADWKRFRPLEATPGEMASIAKLYRDNISPAGITLLEGTQASKRRFCEEAIRHKYLHIATHGFFAPPELTEKLHDSAERSRAARMLSDTSPQFLGFPSGLLSGIALAGANLPPEPDREDGILTASEVENLDLRGVRLAVLSACETGIGELAGGEGLLGLQRAFQVAGAESVVASLWEVNDESTRSLMERFYGNLLQNPKIQMSKLDALRQAQLWMLRENRDRSLERIDPPQHPNSLKRTSPRHWAAFILSGDWR